MKRISVLLAVLLICVLLVPGAAAKKPEDPFLFQLVGYMVLPPDIDDLEEIVQVLGPGAVLDDPTTWKHVKIRGISAQGYREGDIVPGLGVYFESAPFTAEAGDFVYTEDININPKKNKSTEQGDMTLTIDTGDYQGTINVRFHGKADLEIKESDHYPGVEMAATVIDQPWNIKGGTGDFAGVKGKGKRSTCPGDYSPLFCVDYSGTIRGLPE